MTTVRFVAACLCEGDLEGIYGRSVCVSVLVRVKLVRLLGSRVT